MCDNLSFNRWLFLCRSTVFSRIWHKRRSVILILRPVFPQYCPACRCRSVHMLLCILNPVHLKRLGKLILLNRVNLHCLFIAFGCFLHFFPANIHISDRGVSFNRLVKLNLRYYVPAHYRLMDSLIQFLVHALSLREAKLHLGRMHVDINNVRLNVKMQ